MTREVGVLTGDDLLFAVKTNLSVGEPECVELERLKCSAGQAQCRVQMGTAHCECLEPGKVFYDPICDYPCTHSPKEFCPSGACYKQLCFKDLFTFASHVHASVCCEYQVFRPALAISTGCSFGVG